MKKTSFLRLCSLFLAVTLLAGCSMAKKAPEAPLDPTPSAPATQAPADPPTQPPTEPPTEPPQLQLPQQELEQALVDADLSLLCAVYSQTLRTEKLLRPSLQVQPQLICHDSDGDGFREVLLGKSTDIVYSLRPQRSVSYVFHESSPNYYTDRDGNLYQGYIRSDGFDIEYQGQSAWSTFWDVRYCQLKDNGWQDVISYFGFNTHIDIVDENGQPGLELVESDLTGQIHGKDATKAEVDAHLSSVEMTLVNTQPAFYTVNRFEIAYRDSLLGALDQYFAENYYNYPGMFPADVDNDGQEETVFLLPDYMQPWLDHITPPSNIFSSVEDSKREIRRTLSGSYTGILIADAQQQELVLGAYCLPELISGGHGMPVSLADGLLILGDYRSYLTGSFASVAAEQLPSALVEYLSDFGYSDSFVQTVDISDYPQTEYLCLSRKDGQWCVFVFVIIDGDPVPIYNQTMEGTALFLTQHEGKPCLMQYYQSVYEMDGIPYYYYNYELIRISGTGERESLVFDYVNYSQLDQNAAQAAQFFQRLQVYLIQVRLLYDPYLLTGKMWPEQTQVDFGTVPANPLPPSQEESQEPVIGFVHIQDPASWLHLRVGPGITYDKVLMNPEDPASFVRQALGSPVTVLESIETGDPENPVWLKIRIVYQGQEIIGYSSKTYIRLANE